MPGMMQLSYLIMLYMSTEYEYEYTNNALAALYSPGRCLIKFLLEAE
jgi:hypothetical protein